MGDTAALTRRNLVKILVALFIGVTAGVIVGGAIQLLGQGSNAADAAPGSTETARAVDPGPHPAQASAAPLTGHPKDPGQTMMAKVFSDTLTDFAQ